MEPLRALRIFGFDQENMADTAQTLHRHGFSSLVGHADAKAATFFAQNGLDYYAVEGAFHVDSDAPENLCVDIEGNRVKWFGSACPNSPAAINKCLSEARRIAGIKNLTGIIVDGARFASPAGANSFFTCLCRRCKAKMAKAGFDPERIERSLSALHDRSQFDSAAHRQGIEDWLAFRRLTITRFLRAYVAAIREVNPALKVGIYIFTPSIAPLVGQSYADLSEVFDFLSPMIYRHYDAPEGPACLDHELIALMDARYKPIQDMYAEITGLSFEALPSVDEILKSGLPVAYLEEEVRRAKALSRPDTEIIPIIMLKDSALNECIEACLRHGIKTVDFFLYDRQALEAEARTFAVYKCGGR